jgi:2-methylaconitate cis-trans-isomerase PrpF
MSHERIPCVVIRGGTSRGVFFHEHDLPRDASERRSVILSAFGSPDRRQIDGLGGATPETSKLAIISPSKHPKAHVDYTFAQVGIGEPTLNYSLNCGNLAAGAAIFAVDEGLVTPEEPWTTVSILCTNSQTLCRARVEVRDGRAVSEGDFSIDGVPGPGSPIELTFPDVAGAATGKLLPTGKPVDRIRLGPGLPLDVSLIDAGNLYALTAAGNLGLTGDEPAERLGNDPALVDIAKRILVACTERIRSEHPALTPRVQKLALIRQQRGASPCDVVCRILSADGSAHRTFAVTGAIAVGFAAFVEGSVVHRALQGDPRLPLRIGHPLGIIPVAIDCELRDGERRPTAARIWRTARRLMEGFVWVRTARRDHAYSQRPAPRAEVATAEDMR